MTQRESWRCWGGQRLEASVSQSSTDVLQVLEAASSCCSMEQLLLLHAIRAGEVTARVRVCVCGGGGGSEICPNMVAAYVKLSLSLKMHL